MPEGVEGGLCAGEGWGACGCRGRSGGSWERMPVGRWGAGGCEEDIVCVFCSGLLAIYSIVDKPKRTMDPFLTRPAVPESLPCPRVEMLVNDVGGWRRRCVWHP